jgi:hypothetical protein
MLPYATVVVINLILQSFLDEPDDAEYKPGMTLSSLSAQEGRRNAGKELRGTNSIHNDAQSFTLLQTTDSGERDIN